MDELCEGVAREEGIWVRMEGIEDHGAGERGSCYSRNKHFRVFVDRLHRW